MLKTFFFARTFDKIDKKHNSNTIKGCCFFPIAWRMKGSTQTDNNYLGDGDYSPGSPK